MVSCVACDLSPKTGHYQPGNPAHATSPNRCASGTGRCVGSGWAVINESQDLQPPCGLRVCSAGQKWHAKPCMYTNTCGDRIATPMPRHLCKTTRLGFGPLFGSAETYTMRLLRLPCTCASNSYLRFAAQSRVKGGCLDAGALKQFLQHPGTWKQNVGCAIEDASCQQDAIGSDFNSLPYPRVHVQGHS